MPTKKNVRIRNRPRNKANRLKLLENQSNNDKMVIQEQQKTQIELCDPNESEVDDDDMPDLVEEQTEINEQLTPIQMNAQQGQDGVKVLQNLMNSKFLQKDAETNSSCETKLKHNVDLKDTSNPNNKLGKSKEKLKESESGSNASEKNAFIQNLQKKVEAMMAKGDENVPNTLMENLKKMFDQGPVTDIETSDDEEEYIEYIYKPRKYFLVALCNLCKADLCKLSERIECSKCHMTYYCTLEHMHNDAEHKQLCRALQQVAKESCDGHIFKNCSTMPADNFRSYRIVTIRKIESVLKRSLNATEQEVILFPRLCNYYQCREYNFTKLHDCSECGMIAYCLDHPEHMNPENHAKWCKSYQLFKELVQFQEKFGRLDPALPMKILKEIPMGCLNTQQIFNKLGYDIPENCEYASLTQISTGPLTAWYALKLADQLKNHESLTIHLIGAEIEFEVDVLQKWEFFFLHITPGVKNLNIVFVGPELNPNNISFEQLQKTKCCSICRKSGRNVQYFFKSYIYHEYCGLKQFLSPDLNGCHIEIHPNGADAVDYYNYKGWYSTVLFAMVDYRYRFQYINVGSPGRCNDSQIFEKSLLNRYLHNCSLLSKMSRKLSGVDVPVLLLGDSAFRLSKRVMKPFPFNTDSDIIQKQYNYSLSKCRRVVENAFGHLKARFRRLGKGIDNKIENVNSIVKACCVLHNFLNENNDAIQYPWLQDMQNSETYRTQPHQKTNLCGGENGKEIRQAIATYIGMQDDVDGADISLNEELDVDS